MAKKKKEKTGRVVMVTHDDNTLLKKYFLWNESKGVTLSNQDICSQIFATGLHAVTKAMEEDK